MLEKKKYIELKKAMNHILVVDVEVEKKLHAMEDVVEVEEEDVVHVMEEEK